MLVLTLSLPSACTKKGGVLLSDAPNGLYAIIETEKGKIALQLYYTKAPMTVTNFVGLATGAFSDAIARKGNYYDGLTFHRVVADLLFKEEILKETAQADLDILSR